MTVPETPVDPSSDQPRWWRRITGGIVFMTLVVLTALGLLIAAAVSPANSLGSRSGPQLVQDDYSLAQAKSSAYNVVLVKAVVFALTDANLQPGHQARNWCRVPLGIQSGMAVTYGTKALEATATDHHLFTQYNHGVSFGTQRLTLHGGKALIFTCYHRS